MTLQSVLNSTLNSVGRHCILELYDCPGALLDDQAFVQQTLKQAANIAKSTLLGELSHKFSPQGVTALVLLAESHISIHTWPEAGYAAVDVFTCGEHTLPEEACRFIAQQMEATRHELSTVARSGPPKTIVPDSFMSWAV